MDQLSILKLHLCGASGTGKTTLANRVAEDLKITAITNATREVPKEERGTVEGQKKIYKLFYDVMKEQDKYIQDRSLFDVLAYNFAYGLYDSHYTSKDFLKHLTYTVDTFKKENGAAIYIPIEFAPEEDGERPTDKELLARVDQCLSMSLAYASLHNVPVYKVTGTVEERAGQVAKIVRWSEFDGGHRLYTIVDETVFG